jgi:hypothetical protein
MSALARSQQRSLFVRVSFIVRSTAYNRSRPLLDRVWRPVSLVLLHRIRGAVLDCDLSLERNSDPASSRRGGSGAFPLEWDLSTWVPCRQNSAFPESVLHYPSLRKALTFCRRPSPPRLLVTRVYESIIWISDCKVGTHPLSAIWHGDVPTPYARQGWVADPHSPAASSKATTTASFVLVVANRSYMISLLISHRFQVQGKKTYAGQTASAAYHQFTVKECLDVHLLKPARVDILP